jgi:isopentenyl-diphosphate delta-isomerase
MDDEYLDLVDAQDRVIGRKLRSAVYAEGAYNFRVVNAFVRNSAGYLWIPRRTAHKRLYPLCLDMSVGGHVASGETYDEAFARETREELRIDTAVSTWRLLGCLTPHEHGVSAFMRVYEIARDDPPDYNPDDFTEYFWLLPGGLLERIARGDKAKSDLPKLTAIFYPSA